MENDDVSMLRSEHQAEMEMAVASEDSAFLPVTAKPFRSSPCAFLERQNYHHESAERSKAAAKLYVLIIAYLIAMAVEILGGLKANSLAVITDAAHLLTDVAGFSLSLFAVWASGWEATSHHSFGFNRLEVLGALLSVQLIWLISGLLSIEAIGRFLHKSKGINGGLMFTIAGFGFLVNLVMVLWLGHDHSHHAFHGHSHVHDHDSNHSDHSHHAFHGHSHVHDHVRNHGDHHAHNHDHVHNHDTEGSCPENDEEIHSLVSVPKMKTKILNINIQGAYLHVMTDLIQSIGVMIAGAIIWAKPDWVVVDLICTLLFSVLVLCTTIPMIRDIYVILMQSAPTNMNLDKLETDLKCIKGVQDVHDLHIWAITIGKYVLSCHVVAEPGANCNEILNRIRDHLRKTYEIHHVTVQVEQYVVNIYSETLQNA